jgi:uncharacterized protein YjbI with pentapeptide repeats
MADQGTTQNFWDWYFAHADKLAPAATVIGAVATILVGVVAAWIALARHRAQTNADIQRRITESYSKAVTQLASDKMEERLGGIYTLERISRESKDDYWTVMETLTAFVRERSHQNETESPATDIAAVLTVIKRRSRADEWARSLHLDFRGAVLRGVDLTRVDLTGANLTGTNLTRANLSLANLSGANLTSANLTDAHLRVADLTSANLTGADLTSADLYHANLTYAKLFGTSLIAADLTSAKLIRANLTGAKLTRANLTYAKVSQEQLHQACGSDAKLPPRLTLKPCPLSSSS